MASYKRISKKQVPIIDIYYKITGNKINIPNKMSAQVINRNFGKEARNMDQNVPDASTSEENIVMPEYVYNPELELHLSELFIELEGFYDHDDETPDSLRRLQDIAEDEKGWFQLLIALVNNITLDDPVVPTAAVVVVSDCPLHSIKTLKALTNVFGLCTKRATSGELTLEVEHNYCLVLGCLARRLAGPVCCYLLTEDALDFLVAVIITKRDGRLVLSALLAIEKFAQTIENMVRIRDRFSKEAENPLLEMEKYASSHDYQWRQIGFCVQWMLDNFIEYDGRKLSYEGTDLSNVRATVTLQNMGDYMKISCDGLEVRNDYCSYGKVRTSYRVRKGCWYYECLIISSGLMQVGWATRDSHFMNHDEFEGAEMFSLTYDGFRRLIWYEQRASATLNVPTWSPGDVVGCFIDMNNCEAIFSLNGVRLPIETRFNRRRCGLYAAVSLMTFQQCRFNFGSEPFLFPPEGREFHTLNQFATLSANDKMLLTQRKRYFRELLTAPQKADVCNLCYDRIGDHTLYPCRHSGFCRWCTWKLEFCPMCRCKVTSFRVDESDSSQGSTYSLTSGCGDSQGSGDSHSSSFLSDSP